MEQKNTLSKRREFLANWAVYNECPTGSATNNSGTLQSYKEFQGGTGYPSFLTFNQTFNYDGLNRLTSASDTGGWSRTFNYDRWGNSWVSNVTGPLAGNTPTSNVYNSKNQDARYTYDAAGNLGTLNSNTPTYDAENRMTSLVATGGGSESILYDAMGRRVQKSYGGNTTVYVYDNFGTLSSEYVNGAWSRDYIADGSGRLIATENSSGLCTTCYFGTDHLGSVRIVMDQNAKVVARHDYLPFGEELLLGAAGRTTQGFNVTSDVTQKFTRQIRDQESGEDFFNARYFTAPLGRFNSPDPMNAGASLLSSQSWNGYGYVLGNPMNGVDPSGRSCASRSGPVAHTAGCSGNYGADGGGVSIDGGSSLATGTFGGGNPAGGESATQGVTVTETTWVSSDGSVSPQNAGVSWFGAVASLDVNIGYYPQATAWVMSGARQYVALADDDPLGGSYAGALALVGQNVDAQYAFLGKFAGGAALVGVTGGLAVNTISALPTMQVAIGTSPAPLHVIYGVGATGSIFSSGVWQQGVGELGVAMRLAPVISSNLVRYLSTNGYSLFNLPVRNTGSVLGQVNTPVSSCVGAACTAFLRGWGLSF